MQPNDKESLDRDVLELPNAALMPEIVRLLETTPTVTLPLKGISMRPFLEDGRDKALLTKPHGVKVGDPVLAEIAPGHYVLHRIVAIDGDAITLLGDGNITPEHCLRGDIRATAIGFYRKGRQKPDMTDGRKWRNYSKVWMALRPVRRWLLAFYRRIWLKLFKPV